MFSWIRKGFRKIFFVEVTPDPEPEDIVVIKKEPVKRKKTPKTTQRKTPAKKPAAKKTSRKKTVDAVVAENSDNKVVLDLEDPSLLVTPDVEIKPKRTRKPKEDTTKTE